MPLRAMLIPSSGKAGLARGAGWDPSVSPRVGIWELRPTHFHRQLSINHHSTSCQPSWGCASTRPLPCSTPLLSCALLWASHTPRIPTLFPFPGSILPGLAEVGKHIPPLPHSRVPSPKPKWGWEFPQTGWTQIPDTSCQHQWNLCPPLSSPPGTWIS